MHPGFAAVLCHGFYHTPSPYEGFINALKARNIDAYCPQLPTSDLTQLNVGDIAHPNFNLPPPPGGYPQGEEDTKVVLDILKPLIEDGKRVLLIAHSAGGWVATQAAAPELHAKSRQAQGLAGGIVGILYYGAFVIPVGESIHSFFQPKNGTITTPLWLQFYDNGRDGLGTLANPEKFIFNDLDQDVAKKWKATLTASPIVKSKLTNDVYSLLPCGYLVLDGDLTLPKTYQEMMAKGQKAGEFKIYHCPAGHSPHLSWTEGLADTVQDFLTGL